MYEHPNYDTDEALRLVQAGRNATQNETGPLEAAGERVDNAGVAAYVVGAQAEHALMFTRQAVEGVRDIGSKAEGIIATIQSLDDRIGELRRAYVGTLEEITTLSMEAMIIRAATESAAAAVGAMEPASAQAHESVVGVWSLLRDAAGEGYAAAGLYRRADSVAPPGLLTDLADEAGQHVGHMEEHTEDGGAIASLSVQAHSLGTAVSAQRPQHAGLDAGADAVGADIVGATRRIVELKARVGNARSQGDHLVEDLTGLNRRLQEYSERIGIGLEGLKEIGSIVTGLLGHLATEAAAINAFKSKAEDVAESANRAATRLRSHGEAESPAASD